MTRFIILTISLFLLSSCTWVQVAPEGRGVRLLNTTQVSACQRLGTTTSTTRQRVVFVPRGSEKVQEELVDLARNEAGIMGGNAIVADSSIEDGRQRFVVYSCP